jgi:hypothetical protein
LREQPFELLGEGVRRLFGARVKGPLPGKLRHAARLLVTRCLEFVRGRANVDPGLVAVRAELEGHLKSGAAVELGERVDLLGRRLGELADGVDGAGAGLRLRSGQRLRINLRLA